MTRNERVIALTLSACLLCGSFAATTLAKEPLEKGHVSVEDRNSPVRRTMQAPQGEKVKVIAKKAETEEHAAQVGKPSQDEGPQTGPMNLGRFSGQVVYDKEQNYYFLELRGARFPFKTSPLQAQDVLLEAPGRNELEKNTSLLHGIVGPEVSRTTVLINPEEESEVRPASTDIQRYIQVVSRRKFGGLAYAEPGGTARSSVAGSSQVKTLSDATLDNPIVQLKGPRSGATQTRVVVAGDGKVVVEGKTYEDLYKAADFVGVTLLKMLCGSPDCPDAATCATGGNCGCSKR